MGTLRGYWWADGEKFEMEIASCTQLILTGIHKNFKTLLCHFHTFSYGCQYLKVIFIHFEFWNSEGHFHILFNLLDGHIRKWVMSFGFLYLEWCAVNGVEDWDPELIYRSWHSKSHLCCSDKLTNGEIQKWHISSGFIYPKLYNLTY